MKLSCLWYPVFSLSSDSHICIVIQCDLQCRQIFFVFWGNFLHCSAPGTYFYSWVDWKSMAARVKNPQPSVRKPCQYQTGSSHRCYEICIKQLPCVKVVLVSFVYMIFTAFLLWLFLFCFLFYMHLICCSVIVNKVIAAVISVRPELVFWIHSFTGSDCGFQCSVLTLRQPDSTHDTWIFFVVIHHSNFVLLGSGAMLIFSIYAGRELI